MNWADGAIVTIEHGNKTDSFELTPVASCYDGQDYTEEDILTEILHRLGYDVELVYKWELNGTENFGKIVRSDVTFLVFVFIPFVVLFYFVIYGDDRKKKTIYKN